ncbi:hypothetical protein [Sphingomonas immobilis]|uniref:Uncharacterized protein n=1 Tax=Sphingomonas immobilis TaxID=3063997 RepID=A0ABT8ZWB1_9SPHN|nr:hypothetical protein [Sphingomonas sp. CA1-15]MDO7841056.1 hypothetical protein [Sphingomonas sp. CA1-15]
MIEADIDPHGWTEAEYQQLRRLVRARKPMSVITTAMRRPAETIRKAAGRVGIGLTNGGKPPAHPAAPKQAREKLQTLANAKGNSLAELSRMIRRRPGYLATFVREGEPELLERKDRDMLAVYFQIDAGDLGDVR